VGAALGGEGELVQLFLAAGIAVDTPNRLGDRALLMAIRGSYIDLAADLLKAGADPRLGDQNGLTPLIELSEYCDETALLAALIQKGADVNASTRGGHTALKGATASGCAETVRLLKKAGAVR
jgi:ankyrin repeat protein